MYHYQVRLPSIIDKISLSGINDNLSLSGIIVSYQSPVSFSCIVVKHRCPVLLTRHRCQVSLSGIIVRYHRLVEFYAVFP